MVLYFGSRHKSKEYLYGEQMESFTKGVLTRYRCAFSRDQDRKVYIQHKIQVRNSDCQDYIAESVCLFVYRRTRLFWRTT